MSYKISQENFEHCVRDNMECFNLPLDQAIKETISQLKAQGVNMFGIITDPNFIMGDNPVKDIKKELTENWEPEKKIGMLKKLSEVVQKDVAYKVYCGNLGLYQICLDMLCHHDTTEPLKHAIMDFLLVLMDGYPDLLDKQGSEYFVGLLSEDHVNQKYGLKLIRITCMKHEKNRQAYNDANLNLKISIMLTHHALNDSLLVLACKLICALCLDDDMRTETPKSYANAIGLADFVLRSLCYMLKVKKHPVTLCSVLKALISLVVNYTYCADVETEGGLAAVINILEKSRQIEDKSSRQTLIIYCFKFLTALIGNDAVKDKLMKFEIAQEIHTSLVQFMSNKDLVNQALLLISKISLRTPEYGKIFFKMNFPELIIQAMTIYPDDFSIQAAGCWCIRNMSSRNPEYHKQFTDLGAEDILNRIAKLDKCCSYDAKIALQELDCDVNAREPWTGLVGDKLARD